MTVQHILIAFHIIASALWVGGVFMNAFTVWPTARDLQMGKGFPLEFLAMESKRIAPWLYVGAATILVSGIILIGLHPPQEPLEFWLVSAKGVAFAIMIGNTLYGTLVTWPAPQFSTSNEAWKLWRGYGIRAYITFGCGIVAFVMGTVLR